MYEKIHRWSDEDDAVAVQDREESPESEPVERDERDAFVIEYHRRIRSEDEF